VLVALLLIGLPMPVGALTTRSLFTLSDPRLVEASGLALGHRSPSVLYVQNDSGDVARFFALDARTGRTRAVCTVPGATNVDWEDLATGPDAAGMPSIWLADIGDNDAVRTEIGIYRVDEPLIGRSGALSTGRLDHWRLRYPDGAHDAESLIADPVSHRLYVLTKALLGQSELFVVPATPNPNRVQLLSKVAAIAFDFTGTPGGPNAIGQLTATGASMSADGSLLAIRTYTDAYLWRVSATGVPAAVRAPPVRIALPAQPQGEGIAIGNGYLLIDSEGAGSAVYEVPLPAALNPASSRVRAPATTPAPSKAPSQVAGVASSSGHFPDRQTVIGVVVLLALAVVLLVWRGTRTRRSQTAPKSDRV
jgi:hypothetical protein